MGKENEVVVEKHPLEFPLMPSISTETRRKISSPAPTLLCWFESIAYTPFGFAFSCASFHLRR